MIGSITEVVIKIITTVIKVIYVRWTAWNGKKPWLKQVTGQVKTHENIFYWGLQALHGKNPQKQHPEKSGIYNIYHEPLSQEWHWYVMLTKVMNTLYLWFRAVLASSPRDILSTRLKSINLTQTEESFNEISTLES